MSIDADFDAKTAADLRAELDRFQGQCWYDSRRKKVVYADSEAAMDAYMTLQREEMERYRWIESQRADRDLGDSSLSDWVKRHSAAFAQYWRKTHVFVPNGRQNHNDCDMGE